MKAFLPSFFDLAQNFSSTPALDSSVRQKLYFEQCLGNLGNNFRTVDFLLGNGRRRALLYGLYIYVVVLEKYLKQKESILRP